MAPQRKRVLVAGRQVADAEHADQGLELVGQRHGQADRAARQFVAGKTWFVVVFNRVSDLGRQTIVERVVAAHDALQLGKFPDHVGHQIGLGQQRCLVGLGRQRVAAELLANGPGNGAHTGHALALRAKLVVIDHLVEACHARSQRFFAILVKEKLGIGQARTHHALVAADHRAGVCRADVADHEELVRELAGRVEQRKVFLVRLHGEDQAFLRHLEKLFFKGADQHIGPLDQRRDFVEQRIVFNRLDAAYAGGSGRQLARNLGLAFGKAGDHRTVLTQRRRIGVGMRDHDGRDSGFKAMALRAVARLQAQRLQGHHLVAVQRDQAVRRPHKAHAAPARQFAVALKLVTHDLGNRQLVDGFEQGFLQPFSKRRTLDQAVIEQGFGLAVHGTLELRDHRGISPQRRQPLEQRGRGLAAGVKADADGHQFLGDGFVGRYGGNAGDVRGQAARRGIGSQGGTGGRQPQALKLLMQDISKRITQFFQRLGWQLFNKEFEQEVLGRHRHLAHAAFFVKTGMAACIWATHSRGAIGKPKRSRLSK